MLAETKTKKNNIVPNFQVVIDSTDDLIYALDKEYKLLYCNDAFKKSFKIFWDIDIQEGDFLTELSKRNSDDELSKVLYQVYQKALSGYKCNKKVSIPLGDSLVTINFKAIPIYEKDEVVYVHISAKEELRDNLQEGESEIIKAELLSDKEDLIKERDKALQLMLDNAERLQMVMEGSNDAFWDWDFENDNIHYSHNSQSIFGKSSSKKENNFNTWRERIHPDDIDKVLDTLLAHMEGETEQYISEYRIEIEENKWKWILDKAKVVIRDENNHPIRIAGTISEISERKEIEFQLKESEERFVEMSNDLPVMLWVSNRRLQITYQNLLTEEFLGSSEKGNKSLLNLLVHPDDIEFTKYFFKDVLRNKVKSSTEIRLKNSKGEYRWMLVTVVPRLLNNNEMIGFLGVGFDITDRKKAEMQLLESETQFNEITSVVGEGIFVIDEKGYLQFTNPEFKKLLGWNKEELDNKIISNVLKDFSSDELEENCSIKSVLETGKRIRVTEDFFLNKDGTKIPVSYVAAPIKRGGKVVGCVTAFHDITEQKKINEETQRYVKELKFNKELMRQNAMESGRMNEMLQESEERLKELNGSKDKFFSIISHDLRSPFTSITGFSEVMMEDIDTLSKEEIKDFASSIHKTSKNVYNLLENLLQWSRIQTGRIEFNPNKISLSEVVDEVIALYQVNAARKKITLFSNLEVEIFIRADKFMLETILRNLISNSIKFTKQTGEISISAKELKNENKVEITVEDTGVGMSSDIKNKLFKIDEHVTTKGTDKEKGTGLGLILSKEFVEKHEGEIWVESELGVGSKFKFTLKLS
ncbi:MAG: PAS domain S-box protein [Melioribacteraceae bacterium]